MTLMHTYHGPLALPLSVYIPLLGSFYLASSFSLIFKDTILIVPKPGCSHHAPSLTRSLVTLHSPE